MRCGGAEVGRGAGEAVTITLAALIMVIGSRRTPGFAAWAQMPQGLPLYGYEIVRVYPHDPKAFTQGLQYLDGVLYEGTGQIGQSSIRRVELETGKVLQKRDVPPPHFGEGITVWKNELIELTWQTNVAFVYDKQTFEPRRTFKYAGEGWGLTHDATSLYMSDGSDQLRVLDPATFAERRRIRVTLAGAPLRNLNELEWVKGEIFANVWQTDHIVRIAPGFGQGHRLHRFARAAVTRRTRVDRRAERHRVRRGARPALHHGQVVAEAVRDQAGLKGRVRWRGSGRAGRARSGR